MFENYELEIIYQDQYFIAINKPTALLVHKSMIDKGEVYFAMKILRDQIDKWVYPIHRLDKPTSGVLLFALDSKSARLASELFKEKKIQKSYLAIVRGYTSEEGFIDHPLSVKFDKMTDKKANLEKEAQEAQTAYKRVSTIELNHEVGKYTTARYSLVKLFPLSGRKHQLRRHMKHLSHHILGDTKYGRGEHNKMVRLEYDCHRLMLHADSLRFVHAYTQKEIVLRAKVDETWKTFLKLFEYLVDEEHFQYTQLSNQEA